MTNKKNTPQVFDLPKEKHKFKCFVNFYPNASDKEKIKREAQASGRLLHYLEGLLNEGYAFKLSYDVKNNTMQCMMIGERTIEFNQGLIQTGRHMDLATAISAAIYNHMVLAGEMSWEADRDDPFANDW